MPDWRTLYGYVRLDCYRYRYSHSRNFPFPQSHGVPMPQMRRNLRTKEDGDAGNSYVHVVHADMPALREALYDETCGEAEISNRLQRRNRL